MDEAAQEEPLELKDLLRPKVTPTCFLLDKMSNPLLVVLLRRGGFSILVEFVDAENDLCNAVKRSGVGFSNV